VDDTSLFGSDEVVSDSTSIASSGFIAGFATVGAFNTSVVFSFSVSVGAGGDTSVLIKLHGDATFQALVDISGTSGTVLISAGDAKSVDLNFTIRAGVSTSSVFEDESGNALSTSILVDTFKA
jgi:hypothetical protein